MFTIQKSLKITGIVLTAVVLFLAAALILIVIFAHPNDQPGRINAVSGLPNFHRVDPYLFRGAAPTRIGMQALKKLDVKTIIDFRVNPQMVRSECDTAQHLGMRYINLPIRNCNVTSNCRKVFFDTVGAAAANPSDGAVFVHCAHGSDRTGLMVGLWRVQHDGWSYPDALQEMLKYGFFIHRFLGT